MEIKSTVNAIWFSRHEPTEAQVSEIECMGFDLVGVEAGKVIGGIAITTGNLPVIVNQIKGIAFEHKAFGIFGVFPTPILKEINKTAENAVVNGRWQDTDILCYSAHNIQRTVEGGKPTFVHQSWDRIGRLAL